MTTTASPPTAAQAEKWTNWAGDQTCRPAQVASPRSREELAEVVAGAAQAGQKISVAGSGHSFTEAAMTDGCMVRVEALNRVLDADRDAGLVRVEGGMVLADLTRELDRLGLAMENLGDIDCQTISGAISTATHGTGSSLPNISAQVAAIELVAANGEVHQLTEDSEPDLLRAARVGVGALGAISAVTLRTVPAFTLHRIDEPRPLAEVLDGFEELAEANDHFEFFVFPYTETALTIRRNRTDRPPRPRRRARRPTPRRPPSLRARARDCATASARDATP